MATRKNFTLDQGSNVSISIIAKYSNGDVWDLTGYSANASMRRHYTSTNSYSFTCNVSNSTITLSMTSEYSANVPSGRFVYDVEVTEPDSNTTTRISEGVITITPEVTR